MTASNGWSCACGAWVPYGMMHSCGRAAPSAQSWPTVIDLTPLTSALARIENLLLRMLKEGEK